MFAVLSAILLFYQRCSRFYQRFCLFISHVHDFISDSAFLSAMFTILSAILAFYQRWARFYQRFWLFISGGRDLISDFRHLISDVLNVTSDSISNYTIIRDGDLKEWFLVALYFYMSFCH